MITESSLILCHWKIAATGLATMIIGAADMAVSPGTLEDYGLKGLLIIAVVFLARLILKQQAEHKQELKEERSQHQAQSAAREEKMVGAMEKQAAALEKVAAQTEEQTTYFKTVTRGIVDEHLKGPRAPLP